MVDAGDQGGGRLGGRRMGLLGRLGEGVLGWVLGWARGPSPGAVRAPAEPHLCSGLGSGSRLRVVWEPRRPGRVCEVPPRGAWLRPLLPLSPVRPAPPLRAPLGVYLMGASCLSVSDLTLPCVLTSVSSE